MARLIAGFGRQADVAKVNELYQQAQLVLAAIKDQKRWQQIGWFVIEANMIVGLAHAGDHNGANAHRLRILEAGGTPTADAYGALIASVKDTTDDAAYALMFWEEARARGIQPHAYLYNTIISKLSKARKADQAYALLRQMVSEGTQPTPVTYGAIIAAACRVGDSESAEAYFDEMTALPNYKPRSAPYNTMIQLYIYTKPDRERALYYHQRMVQDGVILTGHTYRVCFDIYMPNSVSCKLTICTASPRVIWQD
jgi:pentatricopeptide repeat protein